MAIRSCSQIPRLNAASASSPERRRVASRQITLAAKPQTFLCLQLRHGEQEDKHVELVAPRQPREVGGGLRDQGRGLIRSALLRWIIGSRTPIPALICARPPAPCLAQKTKSNTKSNTVSF